MIIESCTDCFWCKINRPKGIMYCAYTDEEGNKTTHWRKRDDSEKIVTLERREINDVYIKPRKLFFIASTCPSMKSMI